MLPLAALLFAASLAALPAAAGGSAGGTPGGSAVDSAGGSASELVDRIVVVVNDELILSSELDEEVDAYLATDPGALSSGPERAEQLLELREQVLDGLIGRRLMEQAVVRLGIVVDAAEVDAQIADTARANNVSVDELKAELARQGIPLEEFRNDLREQIKQYKLFQAEIGTKIDITEDQLRQRYNERNAGAAEDPELHLRVIVLRFADGSEAARAETLRRAAEVREKFASGVPFDELAREYSQDAGSAERGGEFGTVRASTLIPEFRNAIEGLPLRAVSEPVPMADAVWLLQVHRITDASAASFDELRDSLFQEIYQEEEERQVALWIERERARAHIERHP